MKRTEYFSPEMEVIDVKTEGCLCTSDVKGFSNETYDMDNVETYVW